MSIEKLVSIIIPCFNAGRWLREAIDSCFQQSYSRVEIIVIDDGSTDNCLEIIKSYKDKIIWETGPNRGGNHARNRGFALSSGEYIQYLDADDYLLPEKIERQVRFLEKTKADVVYGDWRYRRHLPNGTTFLEDIQVGGPKEDFLESLLSDDRWLAPMALLFTRDAVINSGGWDESLKAGQDRDFFMSVAMLDAQFAYQPGCYSVYRRYGNVTVSTSNNKRWRDSHFFVMEKSEARLAQSNKLSNRYRQTLAQCYFNRIKAVRADIDYSQYLWVLNKIISLCPDFKAESKVKGYKFFQQIVGFKNSEILVRFVKQLTNIRQSSVQNNLN